MSREVPMLPRKLDWILSERTADLLRIMRENATFIKLPDIGSNASVISVLGDRRSTIERTLRDVALLVNCPSSVCLLVLMSFSGLFTLCRAAVDTSAKLCDLRSSRGDSTRASAQHP